MSGGETMNKRSRAAVFLGMAFANVVRLLRGNGVTPLHVAASWGHANVVRALLEHGADAGARDKDGGTPLHFAALTGQVDAVCALLEHGADAGAQGKDGGTPLHLVPLHFAALNDQAAAVCALLDGGADAEVRGKGGATSLHLAAWKGHADVVRLLRDAGAKE